MRAAGIRAAGIRAWFRVLSEFRVLSRLQRRKRLVDLRRTVVRHLPLLPVLAEQLRDADRQMERAVSQVGANFGRMAQRAREGVEQAARLVGSGDESAGGVAGLLAASRTTLEDLLVRIVRDNEICNRLIQKMAALERDTAHIEARLADVDHISLGNTILALNAKIEAAHMGDRGQGFEIVAQELWQQSRRSEELTEAIRATILQLAETARDTMAGIRQMAASDTARIQGLQGQAREALDRLEHTHRDMQQSLAEAAGRSESLTAEIAGAIETMQFQDRVSQRIGHAIEALESIEAALATRLEPGSQASAETCLPELSDSLSRAYTMDAERVVHAAVLGRQAGCTEKAPDVELF